MNIRNQITHEEIAHLAYLNWEREGRPPGKDAVYWLEAERQIQATKHLVKSEMAKSSVSAACLAPAEKTEAKLPEDAKPAPKKRVGQKKSAAIS